MALWLDGRRAILLRGERAPLAPRLGRRGELVVANVAKDGALEIMRANSGRSSVVQRYRPEEPTPRLFGLRDQGELAIPQARGERLEPAGVFAAP